jgi:hypothetical protein
MHLIKKRLLNIIIISTIAVPIIQIATILLIQGIYGCITPTTECKAQLSSASITSSVGIGLVYIALAVDIIAVLMLIYFFITKKK